MTMTDTADPAATDLGSEGDLLDLEPTPPEEEVEQEQFNAGRALALVGDREAAEVSLFPERSELEALAGLAVTLSASGLVPKDLRGKPNDVLVVLLTARELRIDYMTALRECAPINGKVTLSPKLRVALVIDRGLGDVWYDPANTADSATVYAQRTGSERVDSYTFTWADAMAAGLVDRRCKSSTSHVDSCKCDMYRKYGRNMLKWRAAGYLLDESFPHSATGLYSPEELGATVDEDGRAVLDVASAEALPGMKRGGPGQQSALDDPPIGAEDLADLERRIPALPEEGVAALRELWQRSLPKPQDLLARQVKVARAMLESIEKRAEQGEWGAWSNWTRPSDGPVVHEPADFQAGAGKSPQQLARERQARQAAEAAAPPAAESATQTPLIEPEPAAEPDDAPTTGDGDEALTDEQREALEAYDRAIAAPSHAEKCSGCDAEFAKTASGKNSPGPRGRSTTHPAYHRECEPFD